MRKRDPFDLVPALRKSLIFPMTALIEIIEERINKFLVPYGLTWREGLVIFAAHEQQTPQTALGAALGINKNVMSELVDRLERRGIMRRVANPKNRRSYLIALTAKGAKIGREFHEIRDRIVRDIYHPLSVRDAEQALRWACQIVSSYHHK